MDESGGSIVISVPVLNIKELNNFFKVMEDKMTEQKIQNFKGLIRDWGLSHATLEDVFMKITRENKSFKWTHSVYYCMCINRVINVRWFLYALRELNDEFTTILS